MSDEFECEITISRTIELPKSSIIRSVSYHVNSKSLQIEFHPNDGDKYGGTYVYSDVPEELVKEMIKSKSVGSFFRERIRDVFEYEKVI